MGAYLVARRGRSQIRALNGPRLKRSEAMNLGSGSRGMAPMRPFLMTDHRAGDRHALLRERVAVRAGGPSHETEGWPRRPSRRRLTIGTV
jgi:hypothetical protein